MNRVELLSRPEHFPVERLAARTGALAALKHKLVAAGYDEVTLARLLRLPDVWAISFLDRALLKLADRYLLNHHDPLHVMVRLFLLAKPETASATEAIFDGAELTLLEEAGLLARESPTHYRAQVAFFPVRGHLIATDWAFEGETANVPTRVDRPGFDSYALARFAMAAPGGNALDLCTGSGIVALELAARGARVVGVDINARCINFSRFNALFNGVDGCSFVVSDGYDAIGKSRFDVITANPPYLPSPERHILSADGGPTGEAVTAAIVRGLPEHLAVGGSCQIQTIMVDSGGQTFADKLRGWLGEAPGLRCLLLTAYAMDPIVYAVNTYAEFHPEWYRILADDRDEPSFFRWVENYLFSRIDAISIGYVCVQNRGRGPFALELLPMAATADKWPLETPNYPPFPPGSAHGELLPALWAGLDRLDAGAARFRLRGPLPATHVELRAEHPLFRAVDGSRGMRVPVRLYQALAALGGRAFGVADIVAEMGGACPDEPALAATLRQLYLAGFLSMSDP